MVEAVNNNAYNPDMDDNNITNFTKNNTNNNTKNNSCYNNKGTTEGGSNSYKNNNMYPYELSIYSSNDDTDNYYLDPDDPNFIKDYWNLLKWKMDNGHADDKSYIIIQRT